VPVKESVQNSAPLALVTGGHRRLGAVIAEHLARAGYALAIHGSHDIDLDLGLAEALRAENSIWHGFVADFEQPDNAASLIDNVRETFGRAPDLLVNSAALFGQDVLDNVTATDLMRHYTVNCMAPVLLTKAFAAAGQAGQQNRNIINILDQRLAHPHGDQLSYTLAKQALAGFTQIAARSLAPHIRVNAIAPGLTIATADYSKEQVERLAAMMPLGRLPSPDQIAQAVVYLAGARAVTGQVLTVDGGAHMQSYARDFMHL
jgi:NAD(P)-dependent dehydrogenase (short-subunit alcohol dehydrogenase family)